MGSGVGGEGRARKVDKPQERCARTGYSRLAEHLIPTKVSEAQRRQYCLGDAIEPSRMCGKALPTSKPSLSARVHPLKWF